MPAGNTGQCACMGSMFSCTAVDSVAETCPVCVRSIRRAIVLLYILVHTGKEVGISKLFDQRGGSTRRSGWLVQYLRI